jgi:hypothetical protein
LKAGLPGKASHAPKWSTVPFGPFFNVNTPEDLAEAEALVRRRCARNLRMMRDSHANDRAVVTPRPTIGLM